MRRILAILAILLVATSTARAVTPDEVLDDPALETRAREISAQLRCLVCQNQSIDDSDAQLAHDLRVIVRDRLKAGDTNDQVMDYVVARYGEFVLLKPRFSARNLLLWGTPVLGLLAGGLAIVVLYRRRSGPVAAGAPLSPEEEERLARILEDGDQAGR